MRVRPAFVQGSEWHAQNRTGRQAGNPQNPRPGYREPTEAVHTPGAPASLRRLRYKAIASKKIVHGFAADH